MSKVWGFFSIVGLLASLCLLGGGSAAALSPPPQPPAEILFSNGGRIATVKADGTGRRILTRAGKVTWPGSLGQDGDFSPSLSPDGSRMLFIRRTGQSTIHDRAWLMLANAGGGGARKILENHKSFTLNGTPRFTSDGRRLVLAREQSEGRGWKPSVVTIKPNGAGMKTIFKLRVQKDTPHADPRFELRNPSISPDGSRLLVEVNDVYADNASHLEVVDLASGKRRSLGAQTYSGSWSADGDSVLFVSSKGTGSRFCVTLDYDCLDSGDLFSARADGSDRHRLSKTRANEDSPSWSPDGNRILFTSNQVMPRSKAATEVYSMRPDGSCRTALTNGSPGSFSPAWAGGQGYSLPAGDTCRQAPPPVSAEVTSRDAKQVRHTFWAGSDADGLLLSASGFSLGLVSEYGDCDLARPAGCGSPLAMYSIPACFWSGNTALIYGESGPRFGIRRGAGVAFVKRGGERFLTVMAGSSSTFIAGRIGADRRGWASQLGLLGQMRPIQAPELRSGDLARPRVPIRDVRKLRRVEGKVKRLGSVRRAAAKLKMKRKAVRRNLRFGKRIRRLGPIRPLNCSRFTKRRAASPRAAASHVRRFG